MSVVSVAEVTGGMRANERREVWRLFAAMHVVAINDVIARRAGEVMRRFRRSHAGIGLGDYLVAGTVDALGFELATLNVRTSRCSTTCALPSASVVSVRSPIGRHERVL